MVDLQTLYGKGGTSMSAEHIRLIQKIYWLLEDCGMPNQMPSRELFYDLFSMIQEHAEYTGLDLE